MIRQTPYPAPDFSLYTSDGRVKKLSDYKGTWLVIYFYPKDATPGCTVEACSVRDVRDDLTELGAEVIGISQDSAASHEAFKAKHTLNFDLLSDPTLETIKAYDAWGKKQFGKEGILRRTYIISPEQQVVKVFGRVIPLGHGEQIVETLKQLQNERD